MQRRLEGTERHGKVSPAMPETHRKSMKPITILPEVKPGTLDSQTAIAANQPTKGPQILNLGGPKAIFNLSRIKPMKIDHLQF